MVKQKYFSGGLMILVGLGTAVGIQEYSLGTLARMGPGYFPFLLGIGLTILGLLIAVTPDSPDEIRANSVRLSARSIWNRHARPWSAIIGGMIAFIILGRYGGLAPATFTLIFLAALGDRNNSLKACFGLAVGVLIFAVAVFHYGMQLQFPLFSWG